MTNAVRRSARTPRQSKARWRAPRRRGFPGPGASAAARVRGTHPLCRGVWASERSFVISWPYFTRATQQRPAAKGRAGASVL